MLKKSLSAIALCLLIVPTAWANRLQSFIYDASRNRIEFSLTADTEPRGMVIYNPLRLVIDLPQVSYHGATIRRQVGTGIASLRIGKLDEQTTRLVVEFAPQVTFDPASLRLKTDSAGQWSIDLPPEVAIGSQAPTVGLMFPVTGQITSGFGYRLHPITGERKFHRGIDIAAPIGTPIMAVETGTVIEAGWDNTGYGNLVKLLHPDGSITLYAHTNRILVQKGQVVQRGETIAEVGSTGLSTAPHLHFEILPDGRNVADPLQYLGNQSGLVVINLS